MEVNARKSVYHIHLYKLNAAHCRNWPTMSIHAQNANKTRVPCVILKTHTVDFKQSSYYKNNLSLEQGRHLR